MKKINQLLFILLLSCFASVALAKGNIMNIGYFYFVTDEYYSLFPDKFLMPNKPSDNTSHDRPCFFAFLDEKTNLNWLVPVSSQVNKYQEIYNHKIAKYKVCDTIVIGNFLGGQKAFLIQNMFPVTKRFILNEYFDNRAKLPARVDMPLQNEIISKAKNVLALHRKGMNLIFPNVLNIEKELLKMPN